MATLDEKTVVPEGHHNGETPDLAERGRIDSEEHKQAIYDQKHPVSKWTRMGVTPASFKRRIIEGEDNQLNQTVKMRHLHMIGESHWQLQFFRIHTDNG